MREILTGLAIVLILVLTTILVAPYFVDWNGQRDFLEARLSHALGQKVTIGGRIDLKLLPTPYLVLDQVVVGADDGPLKIGVHHLDLELTVAPLLHGEFDIVEAALEEPTIRLNLEHDHRIPQLPTAPAFEADVRFERIHVSDGTLAVADPQSGYTFVLDHVDLDAEAGSLAGPFKLAGIAGPAGRRTRFRLATSEAQQGKTHARLVIDATPAHVGAEVDGALRLRGPGSQSFDGSLSLTGHVADVSDDPTPWKLAGHLVADTTRAAFDAGELRLGSEDTGVTFQANGAADFTQAPKLVLNLTAKQLDLDRLSGAPVDAVKPPPPKLPDLATLRRVVAAAEPPIRTELNLTVDNATYGNEAFNGVAVHATIAASGATPLTLAADGPGGSHVAIDGTVTPSVAASGHLPSFEGTIDLTADNVPRGLDWLRSVDPTLAVRDTLGIDSAGLKGRVRMGPGGLASDALALTLDGSTLTGPVRLAFGDDRHASKITAKLHADRLDLAALPDLDKLRGASGSFDLDLHLGAKAVKVAHLGDGSLDTGRIDLVLLKTGRALDLERFRADNLGGASIAATGHLDLHGAAVTASVDAGRVEAAAALVAKLLPGAPAQALVARAASLAPAKIKIDAALTEESGGRFSPSRLSIAGTLGTTTVDITAKPDAGQAGATAISASLRSPDGNKLLGQLGAEALPIATIGAAKVELAARGHVGDRLETKLDATLGATRLKASGAFDLLSGSPHGAGRLHLTSADVAPLLQSLAVAFPDMTARLPAEIAGDLSLDGDRATLRGITAHLAATSATGALAWRKAAADQPALTGTLDLDRLALSDLLGFALGPAQAAVPGALWSRQPFTVGLVDPPRAALTLMAKDFDIAPGVEAHDARLDLGVAQNLVTLGKVAAALDGGHIDGGLSLRRDGRQATVEGNIGLDGVAVRLPSLDTKLTARLDLAGSGSNAAGLVASLAGTGTATAASLDVHGGDPAALPKVFGDVESDVLAVDQETIARALAEAGRAPLPLGTRHFSLGLAAGVLHFDPQDVTPVTNGGVSSTLDGALDLSAGRLETHLGETLHALPKNWSGPPPTVTINLAGPIEKPTRTYDVSAFLDAVAQRALARESARIEAYEFDIRERAFFNARLQSERRRDADRQKAEDDAKKAEAARQAKLRAEQAAKAARDQAAQDKAAQDKAAQDRAAQDRAGQPVEGSAPDAGPGSAPPQSQRPPANAGPPPPDPSTLGRY